MKRICESFNRYRDGVLDLEEWKQFDSHLGFCQECRTRIFFLNSLVHAIKNQAVPTLTVPSEAIAVRAYENWSSWDFLFLSWLRPAPAWSALVLLVVLLSIFWVSPSVPLPAPTGEYEVVMTESDPATLGDVPQDETDEALVAWLEQGGNTQ